MPHKQRKSSLSSLLLWPSWRFKVLCRWGWCITMSFSCERQRNIITLTLDFHFPWIISFLFHFQEHISSFSTTEENYITLVMLLTTKLWFTVEMKHETCLKYALWKCSYQHSTVITQPDKQLFLFGTQHKTTVQIVCLMSFNICLFFLPYVLRQPCHVKIIVDVNRVLGYLTTDSRKLIPRKQAMGGW